MDERVDLARGTGQGTLIIIGGHEDKEGNREILCEVARRTGSGKLVIAALATEEPEETIEEYRRLFSELGVGKVESISLSERAEALEEGAEAPLDGATAVFFPGGDQLRITSQIGDSRIFRRIEEIYRNGGTVAGTSAGASVMSETMLVSGHGDESHKVGSSLQMAPGLGLLHGVVIDQHFAERGRLSRLLTVVAQNPRNLGIGIDEDTAIVVEEPQCFRVIGSGAVYVLDGRGITHSNLMEGGEDKTLAVYDVLLHVLSAYDEFDLTARRPTPRPAEDPASGKDGEKEEEEEEEKEADEGGKGKGEDREKRKE